jgi:hypothetical protein
VKGDPLAGITVLESVDFVVKMPRSKLWGICLRTVRWILWAPSPSSTRIR